MQSSPVVDYASPATSKPTTRLLSLDVFRGLVILAMLLVNNIGDYSTTGYFWKHADWVPMSWGQAWRVWWRCATNFPAEAARVDGLPDEVVRRLQDLVHSGPLVSPTNAVDSRNQEEANASLEEIRVFRGPWSRIPLFTQCTLADYVMPSFILIIGVAIPFSVASSRLKKISARRTWLRVFKRAAMLVLLGWIVCYFRDQFANSLYGKRPWTFSLGMDVLQLLGLSYLVARILYELGAIERAVAAGILLLAHWALLRFGPQGDVPRGTFNEQFNALEYAYAHWRIWDAITLHLGPLTIGWRGLLSVPPAAAAMVIGTLVGDRLRRDDETPIRKVKSLAIWGFVMIVIGVLWAFDLPFNKPCWTPSYLMYVSGVGTVLLAILYWIIDVKQIRRWTYPLVVFGTNAIALYFCSIMVKVLFLNTPRIHGEPVIQVVLSSLKSAFGAWAGGWTLTILYITIWWVVLDQMYRRKLFWKL